MNDNSQNNPKENTLTGFVAALVVCLFGIAITYLLTKPDNDRTQEYQIKTQEYQSKIASDIDRIKNHLDSLKIKDSNQKDDTKYFEEVKPEKPQLVNRFNINTPVDESKSLVIAGNFVTKEQALSRKEYLCNLGFLNTRVHSFSYSEYFTVVVDEFDSISPARQCVKELKNIHKVDSYLRVPSKYTK